MNSLNDFTSREQNNQKPFQQPVVDSLPDIPAPSAVDWESTWWLPSGTSFGKPASQSQSSDSRSAPCQLQQQRAYHWGQDQLKGAWRFNRGHPAPVFVSRTSPFKIVFSALGPFLLAALLLPLSQAAEAPAPAAAEFAYRAADFFGNLSSPSSHVSLVQVLKGPGGFDWALNASRVTVNVSREEFVEFGNPTNLSEPHTSIAKGPATYSEQSFYSASANSSGRITESDFWIQTSSSPSPRLEAFRGNFSIGPRAPEPNQTLPQDPRAAPEGSAWATQRDGVLVLSGNFSVEIRFADVHVRNDTNNSVFTAGAWRTGIGPAPPGEPHPVREKVLQRLRLDVTNATLELAPLGRSISLASPRFNFDGPTEGVFLHVDGVVGENEKQQKIRQDRWLLSGVIHFETWNQTAGGALLHARISASPEVFGLIPEVPPAAGNQPTIAKPQEMSWPLLALIAPAFLAFGCVGLAAYRRSRPPAIDDVEWALFEKDSKRALRLGRRLVAGNPRDATAIFLYGTALLVNREPRQVIHRLEPLALRLGTRQRVGIAYVLACAARSIMDAQRLERWAAEAAEEPALRAQLARDGVWLPRHRGQ
jgi:hypothetical protein